MYLTKLIVTLLIRKVKEMKKVFMAIAMFLVTVNVGIAQEKSSFRTFELVTPTDAVKSVGGFVLDTGKNVCEGACVTVMGLGDIITAPFRTKFKPPKRRTYIFEPPRFHYQRGRFYEFKAPSVTPPLAPPVPSLDMELRPAPDGCQPPLRTPDGLYPIPLYGKPDSSRVV